MFFIHWQKTSDEDIIPIKNNIAALWKGQLEVTSKRLPFEVNLKSVAFWAIKDMHLHGSLPDRVVFNLKIDSRPFFGKGMYGT